MDGDPVRFQFCTVEEISASLQPVPDVELTVIWPDGTSEVGRTNDDGLLRSMDGPPGWYRVVMAHRGSRTARWIWLARGWPNPSTILIIANRNVWLRQLEQG